MRRKEQCVFCAETLQNSCIVARSKFVSSINRGKLTYPSEEVFFVVKVTNSILQKLLYQKSVLKEKRIIEKMSLTVTNVIEEKRPDLFSALDTHTDDISISHKVAMIHKIVGCFVTIRLKHFCKPLNAPNFDKYIRKTRSKLILFENQ